MQSTPHPTEPTSFGARAQAPAPVPFDLADERGYRAWRRRKLASAPDASPVTVGDLAAPDEAERAAIVGRCRASNMALYRCGRRYADPGRAVLAMAAALGLGRLDRNPLADDSGLATIRASEQAGRSEFIPYTTRRIRWHTDGYYNAPEAPVRGLVMHCVSPAASGGESWLLDPEILYIRLRDLDPAHLVALSRPDAMTVPAHEREGRVLRPARPGPVLWPESPAGPLRLRYTARTRSVVWRGDAATRAAVGALESLLAEPPPEAIRVRLAAGEGVVCNNVLHAREAFDDAGQPGRCLVRARFLDRVAGT